VVPLRAELVPLLEDALDLRAHDEYHGLELVAPSAPLPTLRAAVMKSVELFDKAYALAPDGPMILSGYVLAHAQTWFFADPPFCSLGQARPEFVSNVKDFVGLYLNPDPCRAPNA
jgi:hypothetical protein